MYIYKTTNKITGEFYIGKSSKPEFNPEYYGSGNLLLESLKRYGKSNFKVEVVSEFEDLDDLAKAEVELIKESLLKSPELCMNVSLKSNGGDTLSSKTAEEIELINKKISNKLKGDNNGRRTCPDCLSGEKNGMWGKVSHNAKQIKVTNIVTNETKIFVSIKKLIESKFCNCGRPKVDRALNSDGKFVDKSGTDFVVEYL